MPHGDMGKKDSMISTDDLKSTVKCSCPATELTEMALIGIGNGVHKRKCRQTTIKEY